MTKAQDYGPTGSWGELPKSGFESGYKFSYGIKGKYKMHGWLLALGFMAALVGHSRSEAGESWAKGTVEFSRTHDSTFYSTSNNWAPPVSWFTLAGVAQAGSCPTWNGRVLFVAHDIQELAMVLSALKGGNTLAVYWNDSVLSNGYCTAIHITIRAANVPDIN